MRFKRVVLASGTTGGFKDGKWHRLDGPAYHPIGRGRVWRKDNKHWPAQSREWWEHAA